jgi:hypothetical protein
MLARIVVLLAGLAAAMPAVAGEMKADEARRFVIGKLFSFTCFEGTRGAGRIHADGSVAGTIQFRGEGPVRYVTLPAGTLKTNGEAVCASLRGLFFEPCFDLYKTDSRSFTGSLSGMSFARCNFVRHGAGRANFAAASRPRRSEGSATTSRE